MSDDVTMHPDGSVTIDITVVGSHLYRAIDRDGALVDVMLSEHRNPGGGQALLSISEGRHGKIPTGSRRTATTPTPKRSGRNSVAACGIGQTATSTIAWSRIIVASRADVDRCSASRASHQPDDIAAVTTNSGTSSALVLACANTFPPLRGAFSTCAVQPSLSVCWKLLEPGAPQPGNFAPNRLES